MRIAVIIGRATQDIVSFLVPSPKARAVFKTREVKEIDGIQLELEIGVVVVENLKCDRNNDKGGMLCTVTFVGGGKTVGDLHVVPFGARSVTDQVDR